MITSIFLLILCSSLTIIGLTSFQFNPPFPQPKGGIAIDFISLVFIVFTNSFIPLFTKSIFARLFQCSLVGKFMINFGINCPVLVVNIEPTVNSLLSQASLYNL